MHIQFIEVGNFRKLKAVRVDLTEKITLLVGANNSGKTSAMLALRHFLVDGGRFSVNDFTLSNWQLINAIGATWEAAVSAQKPHEPTLQEWEAVLPFVDVWLHVANHEIHYVSKILPTLNWVGGLLGVRLRFQPKKILDLFKEYTVAKKDADTTKAAAVEKLGNGQLAVSLWPKSMIEFLDRRLKGQFAVQAYVLDPAKCQPPQNGVAQPQQLPPGLDPIDGDPLAGLIKINEINAQRGFGDPTTEPDPAGRRPDGPPRRESRKLSDQLRAYYANHLDPFDKPDPSDVAALDAIEHAQAAFDARLKECFAAALNEVATLGYPGISDPKLSLSTRIRPTDGLDHDAAVQYEIDTIPVGGVTLRLPEDYNGLGYQNLVSMIFRLMSFRDAWMRVGKAGKPTRTGEEIPIAPLHLVLIEEPEAHLHAQVQQVFIRRAYDILRAHPDLVENKDLTTQLVVSTHSSHVVHEVKFGSLRYFRRLPAGAAGEVPVSTVVNLSEVFGTVSATDNFVTRYLYAAHCDLFFADAAILLEGPAERMLVPHFIRTHFKSLNQCYLTWLEIGGSHAHRLMPLIRHLGLPTLIITDLDACDATTGAAAQPTRRGLQKSNNATLKTVAPKAELVDDLLAKLPADKTVTYDPLFSIYVTYQCPVKVAMDGKVDLEALPSTFEDALVFENLDLFAKLDGIGLVKKFRNAIASDKTPADLGKTMFESLRAGKKAEFALAVLDLEQPSKLAVPTYIREGLAWLETHMKKKQVDVLAAQP
jgi:predicted ATP-dependent endonuclease of OLD family